MAEEHERAIIRLGRTARIQSMIFEKWNCRDAGRVMLESPSKWAEWQARILNLSLQGPQGWSQVPTSNPTETKAQKKSPEGRGEATAATTPQGNESNLRTHGIKARQNNGVPPPPSQIPGNEPAIDTPNMRGRQPDQRWLYKRRLEGGDGLLVPRPPKKTKIDGEPADTITVGQISDSKSSIQGTARDADGGNVDVHILGVRFHKCGSCGKACASKHDLGKHQAKHRNVKSGRRKAKQQGAKKTRKITAPNNEQNVGGQPDSSITVGQMSDSKSSMQGTARDADEGNVVSISGVRIHQCGSCSKAFAYESRLRDHKLKHTDVKPFHCNEDGCGKSFKREETFREHTNIHAGVIRFRCQCGKPFTNNSNLRRHMALHTGESFPCILPGCGERFGDRQTMMRHAVIHIRQGYTLPNQERTAV
jgi:hypothetical protein